MLCIEVGSCASFVYVYPYAFLQGHEDDVFVLECSMFNKNLLVTAGHDGRVKLWDIPSGKTLHDYYNMIDGQGFGAAYDCKWSPQHHSFSATDSHGHLMIFGVGENSLISEEKVGKHRYPRIADDFLSLFLISFLLFITCNNPTYITSIELLLSGVTLAHAMSRTLIYSCCFTWQVNTCLMFHVLHHNIITC